MASDLSIDWLLCCLCQTKDNSPLVNPNKNSDINRFKDSSYDRLGDRLVRLNDLNAIPPSFRNIERLNHGNGISNTLKENGAVWHKTCFDMCSEAKIDRARKRKLKNSDSNNADPCSVKKWLRKSFLDDGYKTSGWFFLQRRRQ